MSRQQELNEIDTDAAGAFAIEQVARATSVLMCQSEPIRLSLLGSARIVSDKDKVAKQAQLDLELKKTMRSLFEAFKGFLEEDDTSTYTLRKAALAASVGRLEACKDMMESKSITDPTDLIGRQYWGNMEANLMSQAREILSWTKPLPPRPNMSRYVE